MLGVQRHVTAALAFGVAMLLAAGCGSGAGSDVALTGAETAPGDGASTTIVPDVPDASTVSTTAVEVRDSTTAAELPPLTAADPADSDPSALSGGGAPSRPSSGTSTTSSPPPSRSGKEATGEAEDEVLLRQIDVAVEQQDICGVYSGLARLRLTPGSNARLLVQLTRIRDVMAAASGFAPANLSADWSTLTDGTSDMVESLQQDSDPKASVATHYDDDDYRSASRRVEAWMGRNCA